MGPISLSLSLSMSSFDADRMAMEEEKDQEKEEEEEKTATRLGYTQPMRTGSCTEKTMEPPRPDRGRRRNGEWGHLLGTICRCTDADGGQSLAYESAFI